MSTPRAPVATIRSARSSCRARRVWSSRSIWMETSSTSPSLRTGTRSIRPRPWRPTSAIALTCAGRAAASASASVALVAMSPNSMPRATMVWAIWGRMPEMMHSAPISRAATRS